MYNVLVFPSCNEPGLEICNALVKSNKVTLFAGSSVDSRYDPSCALYKNHVVCPSLYDADFETEFRRILDEKQIDLVFPSVDVLVAEFAGWKHDRAKFVTPNAEAAHLFLSKSKTYRRLQGAVPVPEIFDPANVKLPVFAKPDVGSGSRGAMLVINQEELQVALSRDLMLSEYLPGAEYTVDCVNDLDGRLLFANVRERCLINRGIALGTRSVEHTEIQEYLHLITREIKIEGPWFAQFKADKHGQVKLMEINSRVAGSMALSRLSGVNIPLISLFIYMGYKVEIPKSLPTLCVNRCLNALGDIGAFDWVVWDLDDTIIRKDGKPDPDTVAYLYDLSNRGIAQFLLTRNRNAEALLKQHHLPDMFIDIRITDDKPRELAGLMTEHGIDPAGCVLINDSVTETLELTKQFPGLRVVSPGAMGVLGRERVC